MQIEQNTVYAEQLKGIKNLSVGKLLSIAHEECNSKSLRIRSEIAQFPHHAMLTHRSSGDDFLYNLYFNGLSSQSKFNYAFSKITDELFKQETINIVEYGFGQALGTMCFAEYLKMKRSKANIKTVTIISSGINCLQRSALHVSRMLPDAEIVTILKDLDGLDHYDLNNIPHVDNSATLHILPITEMFAYNNFPKFFKEAFGGGYNQFVCIAPLDGEEEKYCDKLNDFANKIGGQVTFSKSFAKGEFVAGKDIEFQMLLFSVGDLAGELSAETSFGEIADGFADEFGVIYSKDWKRLLKFPNENLEAYSVREGTKVICNHAFFDTAYLYKQLPLKNIFIPDAVEIIGDYAFYALVSLQQIIIPDSVTSIGKYAFGNCHSLQRVVMFDSVAKIGDNAFEGCRALRVITIPDKASLGNNPFYSCNNFSIKCNSSRFVVENGFVIDNYNHILISYFGNEKEISIPDTVVAIGNGAFEQCKSLQRVTIPDTVVKIGDRAFFGCDGLHSIEIPDSVTEIGNDVFATCHNLSLIKMSKSLVTIGDNVFDSCDTTLHIPIPASLMHLGYNTLKFHNFDHNFVKDGLLIINNAVVEYVGRADKVVIPDTVTSIGAKAFKYCSNILQVVIPESVTTIGESAFEACRKLEQINIPNSVISIGKSAFYGCEKLQQVNIPCSLAAIEESVFYNCQSLKQIDIPDSVKSIGRYAFERCISLQQITIPNSVTSIGCKCFAECESLQQISIPQSVTYIEDCFFLLCKSLQDVNLPDTITAIGPYMFDQCSSLQRITIPDSVTTIGDGAFFECTSLQEITIPDSVVSIGTKAFDGCTSLRQIVVPASVSAMTGNPFNGLTNTEIISQSPRFTLADGLLLDNGSIIVAYLKDEEYITIPDTVTSIAANALEHCESMKQITIPASVLSIGKDNFMYSNALQQIIIPEQNVEKLKGMIPLWFQSIIFYMKKAVEE